MGIRSLLAKPLAWYVCRQHRRYTQNAVHYQLQTLRRMVQRAAGSAFGKDHNLASVNDYESFKAAVPIRDYEAMRPYIDRVVAGEPEVLWPGKPLYLAKTSGTTSGVKYIPISRQSISNHINGARDALLHYINATGNSAFLDRKLIFLSGSPELVKKNGILVGRLSGISNHHVPAYLRSNQLPTWHTNCIDDWEQKLDQILDETIGQDMGLISGIPPWVQMYFDRLHARTGKPAGEAFPNFSLFVYGGVNFEPYRQKLMASIGRPVHSVELFPASEGFFAFQDRPGKEGMLMQVNSGIFYEFIPADECNQANPTRLHIGQVEAGKTYSLVVSNTAGLWAYAIGDLVRFVSTKPPRVVVAGRTSHFISAFGEHVIGCEVEGALKDVLIQFPGVSVTEFTVAPQVSPADGLPHHEWFIEFDTPPANLPAFERALDNYLQKRNIYYADLKEGNILDTLRIASLPKGTFAAMMRKEGKLGGQNKVPRLSNDRRLATKLEQPG